MKKMVILIGIQGSGKSEFYKQKLAADYVHINLDTLKTRNNERKLITECIVQGENLAIDNTNPTKAERAVYIDMARKAEYHVIGYFMQSRLQECIARNNMREGKAKIPAKAIAATSNKLELPCLEEGFDELYFVANDGVTMTVSEWVEKNDI